jgi:OmcA/MtrC family decaheme c-type cytochrome
MNIGPGKRPFVVFGVLGALCAAAWSGCGGGNGGPPPSSSPVPTPTSAPTPSVAGAGLVTKIESASIAGGTVVVTFSLTDADGTPITPVLTSGQTEQQARVRFTLAHLEQYSGGTELGNTFLRYVNDVNKTAPAFDSKGQLSTLDAATGLYRFTFSFALPADYDPTTTYSVGYQANRTFQGQAYRYNQVTDLVPAGGTPTIWEDTTTAQCNQCHNPLIAHGSRYEVRLCKLCHTEAAQAGPDEPIDFRLMIHKIHAGIELPSVANGPPGSKYAIGNAIFAQKEADGSLTGVAFPRTLESCTYCHANAPTAEYYLEKPATAACATCHDDVNPSLQPTDAGPPGTKHFQEKGYPEGQCTSCHAAQMDREFDITVPGAHVIPERSTQLKGLNFAITGVANHLAGQTPTISFKITQNDGSVITDLSVFNRIGFALAGPTTDYASVLTPTAFGGGASGQLTGPDGDGVFGYTPAAPIPANATGTWSVGAEARRQVTLDTPPESSPKVVQEAPENPVVTFVVDDSTAEMRRAVVEDQNCAACHGEFSKDFSIHGNLRNQTQYCVLCHNPNNSDFARRSNDPAAVAEQSQDASIDFKVLIHKIHRGAELEQQPYIVYGFGAPPANYTKIDFGKVLFPGNLQDCQTCHLPNTYLLPPYPGTALPTEQSHVEQAGSSVIKVVDGHVGPITSVCTACHDANDAFSHAATNTAPGGAEACPVCHEEGRIAAVSVVHTP